MELEYNQSIEAKYLNLFTTKDCSTDENGGGEGLGLYIIWNIVRMFNGDIVLDKSYENGARFVITINKSEREKNE